MSDTATLAFEIGTEEIPAFDLKRATEQLAELVPAALDAVRIPHGEVAIYTSPRRLIAIVADVAARTEALEEVFRGPAAKIAFDEEGNPTKAAIGFARGKGLDVDALERRDENGTEYVYAVRQVPSQDVAALLPEVLRGVIDGISWPKSCRWGTTTEMFSRPVRWLVALLGDTVIPVEYAGLVAGRETRGHRFLAPGPHTVASADDLVSVVEGAFVVPTQEAREAVIRKGVAAIEAATGFTADLPAKTLTEVINLSEYPTPMVGTFDEEFLKVPEEIIVDAMLMHQRYFPLYDDKGKLTNKFIIVSNGDPAHEATIVDGNERVVAARLYDAKFFYDEDLKMPLSAYVDRLDEVVFQEALGTMRDKTARVVKLSARITSAAGIEAAENDTLKGQQNFASWTDVLNSLAGIGAPGNDVTLTLNSKIQQAAQDALSGYAGACVVMDPETGAVLGMASSPTYDAADFAAEIEKANANPDGESTLLNRAIQTLYAPGSTFKIVTLATALEDGVASEDTVFSSPGTMDIGNAPVTNFNKNSYGDITLARATELSSNTVFGQLGVEMGAEKLVDGADKFGFNRKIDFTLNTATSLMAEPDEMTKWELAWSAAGEPVNPQNHPSPAGPQATVLEMALVGCAIANDGAIMNPYLVEGVYNANGERSFTATPNKFLQAVSKETANRVKDVLKGVVTDGTGTAAALPGVEVAGKTGTAEKENGNDSWFVGMAPADNPRVVVAINLELADEGMGTERAQNVLRTALQVQGLL